MTQITIKQTSSQDTITVDGVVFDRSAMKAPAKRKLSRMIIAAMTKAGRFA